MHTQRDTEGSQGEVETPGEPDTAEEIKDTGSRAQSKASKNKTERLLTQRPRHNRKIREDTREARPNQRVKY